MYSLKGSSSQKLRDMIRGLRESKTQAQEREYIQKELGSIRNSISANQQKYRIRNVTKLIFFSMMGYDTEFGQMECLKLITESNFRCKRIGYLGLTQLFNEKSEVLMMATNRMILDLQDQNDFIISLSLTTVSEVSTEDMCRAMSSEVAKLITNPNFNSYIKKKAILTACQIIKKAPDTKDDFFQYIPQLITESEFSLINATITLIFQIIQIDNTKINDIKQFAIPLIRILKNLLTNYNQECNFQGVTDPFLQIQILKLFRILAENDTELSDDLSDVLAQVVTNTSVKNNPANAVLYENVRTILGIQSANSLKQLAVLICTKFLNQKEPNSKYCALVSLQNIAKMDVKLVQNQKELILEILKESDISIKTLALDLIFVMINKENIKLIMKELVDFLLNCEIELVQEMTFKMCIATQSYAPSIKWYVDTLIKILQLAGNHIEDKIIANFMHEICNSILPINYIMDLMKIKINNNLFKLLCGPSVLYHIFRRIYRLIKLRHQLS